MAYFRCSSGSSGGSNPSEFTIDSSVDIASNISITLTPTITRGPVEAEFSAISSDTSIATVNASGQDISITGVNPGNATVTVTMDALNSYLSSSNNVSVNVTGAILTVGDIYTLQGTNTTANAPIKAVCVQMDVTNVTAIMQSYGFGHGSWPGQGTFEASTYGTTTGNFNISSVQLAKGTSTGNLTACGVSGQSDKIYNAVKDSARHYHSFGAGGSNSWLGTRNGSSGAYYVDQAGSVAGGNGTNYSLVVAPCFIVNLSNVILDTSTNTLTAG